eukprot:gene31270-6414_t
MTYGGMFQLAAEQLIKDLFLKFTVERFKKEIAEFRRKSSAVDLRQPHTWFTAARATQRTIIYHVGPTNSGKTYNALEALKKADVGIYCAPLRLLAVEVFGALNQVRVKTGSGEWLHM